MRREQDRKRREANQELITIKTRLAQILIAEEKNGNETRCDPS